MEEKNLQPEPDTDTDRLARYVYKEVATKKDLRTLAQKTQLGQLRADLTDEIHTASRDTIAAVEAILDHHLKDFLRTQERLTRLEQHAGLPPLS
jgi:hypothetical protein